MHADIRPKVFIVDDDVAFAKSVSWLLASVGIESEQFNSAQSFLDAVTEDDLGCIVTDIRMPGVSGLELQHSVSQSRLTLPVIIMTAHGDVDTAVHAMKRGAFDFIQKPFNDQTFIELIQRALDEGVELAKATAEVNELRGLLATLTRRETEILDHVIEGMTNKCIADTLDISEKTVEAHRASVMQKTGAKSLAELVKLVLGARETQGIP